MVGYERLRRRRSIRISVADESRRESAKRRMMISGTTLAGQPLWSESEVQILRAHAPDYNEIMERLPNRSFEAIRHKCNRLGLSRSIHLWTGLEIAKLRRLYPGAAKEVIIAAFPHSTWAQIKSSARRYGFRRDRLLLMDADHPIVDAIIKRCRQIGWSLPDLDAEAGTGSYFRNCNWKKHPPNFNALLKAIHALGGKFAVIWDN